MEDSSGISTLPEDVPDKAKNRSGHVGPGNDENQYGDEESAATAILIVDAPIYIRTGASWG